MAEAIPQTEEQQSDVCQRTFAALPRQLSSTSPARLALAFLTSATRAGPPESSPFVGRALWNEEAWQWLAADFEGGGQTLESVFSLLHHGDSTGPGTQRRDAGLADGFLAKARQVESVSTCRACMSLVSAELRLIRAALEEPSCQAMLLLSGSCLPLVRLSDLQQALLQHSKGRSIVKYHFMRGGQQRLLGVPLGALQWKLWQRPELERLARLDESELARRWGSLEATMQRYHLAPDEVVLINELREQFLLESPDTKDPLAPRCDRQVVTYTEWEEQVGKSSGPPRSRVFRAVPEKAYEGTALLCRKVLLDSPDALDEWRQKLLSRGQRADSQQASR